MWGCHVREEVLQHQQTVLTMPAVSHPHAARQPKRSTGIAKCPLPENRWFGDTSCLTFCGFSLCVKYCQLVWTFEFQLPNFLNLLHVFPIIYFSDIYSERKAYSFCGCSLLILNHICPRQRQPPPNTQRQTPGQTSDSFPVLPASINLTIGWW